MINRYLTLVTLTIISSNLVMSEPIYTGPKLVVNITIDGLTSENIEAFLPYYDESGLKKLFLEGAVFENAQYAFSPQDRASSLAAISTGASPLDNGITGFIWLDRKTLTQTVCVDDEKYHGVFCNESSSPKNLLTSTISDELKVATSGKAISYSIAINRDAAILSAGHASDGAIWLDYQTGKWCSSQYYFKKTPKWLETFNDRYKNSSLSANASVTTLAIECVKKFSMGLDDTPDILFVSYDATLKDGAEPQNIYMDVDRELGKLITSIEQEAGKGNVLFVVTSSLNTLNKDNNETSYGIPTGTFYINRTANLLNMYLCAIYGQDRYVDDCFYNQIFLSHETLDKKRINISECLSQAQEFLLEVEGVRGVYSSRDLLYGGNKETQLGNWYNPKRCGDLIIEVSSGWNLLNEDNLQEFSSRAAIVEFPIIFYGANVVPEKISSQVTTDRIAPTISKALRIRAPNACSKPALGLTFSK